MQTVDSRYDRLRHQHGGFGDWNPIGPLVKNLVDRFVRDKFSRSCVVQKIMRFDVAYFLVDAFIKDFANAFLETVVLSEYGIKSCDLSFHLIGFLFELLECIVSVAR